MINEGSDKPVRVCSHTRALAALTLILDMGGSRWGTGGLDPPLKNHKNIGFISNTDPDPHKNHKAFNVGPSSARQQNAILMAFRWWADDGPLIVVFGSSLPSSSTKKSVVKVGPPLTKFYGSVHVKDIPNCWHLVLLDSLTCMFR